MTKIDWDSRGRRVYEGGLDRVVLYTKDSPGVPWFGVASINEQGNDGKIKSYYMDGIKYLMVSSYEEFGASISAVNYPPEFAPCIGEKQLAFGLTATRQRREMFGLSYRTLIGSDTQDLGMGYKIHMVYNAMVSPASIAHSTLRESVSLQSYSWRIDTKPIPFPGVQALSHLVIDSREVEKETLLYLESFIYGSEEEDPVQLQPGQILTILSGYELEDAD